MKLFVLDTDILTLFQRHHAGVMARIAEQPADAIAVSVVTVEEQLSGWYAQLRKANNREKRAWAYRRLAANVRFFAGIQILDFDLPEIERYEQLKRGRIKVGKMDLQIAATALQHGATVITRNTRDFESIPGLAVDDWSK